MSRKVRKEPRARRGDTRDLTKNKATLSPNIRMLADLQRKISSIKPIKQTRFNYQRRRASHKSLLQHMTSTLDSSLCPRRSVRRIMKFRIFTDLNKRRIGTFPQKMTISIKTTTEPA